MNIEHLEVSLGERVDCGTLARAQHLAPWCEVEVTRGGHGATLWCDWQRLKLPQVCVKCHGAADKIVRAEFYMGGVNDPSAGGGALPVPCCDAHVQDAKSGFFLGEISPVTGRARLEVFDMNYAKMIQAVNA